MEYEKAAGCATNAPLDTVVEGRRSFGMDTNQDVIAFARETTMPACRSSSSGPARSSGASTTYWKEPRRRPLGDHGRVHQAVLRQGRRDPRRGTAAPRIEEAQIIENWLKSKRGNKVALNVPQRGQKADLVRMASDNATEMLHLLRAQWEADTHKQEGALNEIQKALGLPASPTGWSASTSATPGTAISAAGGVVQAHPTRASTASSTSAR